MKFQNLISLIVCEFLYTVPSVSGLSDWPIRSPVLIPADMSLSDYTNNTPANNLDLNVLPLPVKVVTNSKRNFSKTVIIAMFYFLI